MGKVFFLPQTNHALTAALRASVDRERACDTLRYATVDLGHMLSAVSGAEQPLSSAVIMRCAHIHRQIEIAKVRILAELAGGEGEIPALNSQAPGA